jgi:hypothetical protein
MAGDNNFERILKEAVTNEFKVTQCLPPGIQKNNLIENRGRNKCQQVDRVRCLISGRTTVGCTDKTLASCAGSQVV